MTRKEFKHIIVEPEIYEELLRRMKPGESRNDVLKRLLGIDKK